jgi:predicted PurR-regulated permease PerM
MQSLYQQHRLFFIIVTIAVIGFLIWYFANIVGFILAAVVISILGQPIVRFLEKARFRKIRLPRAITAFVALLLLISVFAAFFIIFIPLAVKEATMISNIDTAALLDHYKDSIVWLQNQLLRYGILPENSTLGTYLSGEIKSIVSVVTFSNLLGGFLSFAGGFFFDLFAVLFLAYFFLYDENLFLTILLAIVPEKYEESTRHVTTKSKKLLSRYFIGLFADVIVMIISYSVGLTIAGVKGAVVIGIFGGIINVIPYIGPVIATITGVLLGTASAIGSGEYILLWPLILKIVSVFAIVVIIDNIIYIPYIFGKSVNAHPVEIFIVILAAGSIGHIVGMIIAVPVYTLLRIIAKEFLSQFRLVQKMTDRI